MVLQKRLDYGFNGYQVPHTPRATRSARRRSISRSKANENQMCAFDLLATVAGKLLLESDSSNSSADTSNFKEQSASLKDSIKTEERKIDKAFNDTSRDQGICNQRVFVSEVVAKAALLSNCSKEHLHAPGDACSGPASVITTSDCSVKVDSPEHLVGDESKVVPGSLSKIADTELNDSKVCDSRKLETENKTQIKNEPLNNGKVPVRSITDTCNSVQPVIGNRNARALVSSDRSVKFPLCKDHISCGSFPVNREDVKLGIRDDDENSGCTQPSTRNKAFRPLPCNGDRRIRKLMASDCWTSSPTMKDGKESNADVEDIKLAYHNRKNGYKRQRSLRDYPFKKRKLYDYNLPSNSDEGVNSDGVCGSPAKRCNGHTSASVGTLLGVTGQSNSSAVERTSLQTTDSHVKLKIKSFRVPELFIEIPETATVGSLKRTVMEAVTAILGGGLHVGVLVQGKKIRDDNKTLLQTGISHNNKSDALGFTLEPNSSRAPLPISSEGRSLLPHDTPQPLARYPAAPRPVHDAVQYVTSDTLPDATGNNFSNFVESDHDSASSPPDMSQEKSAADSRALVAVSSMNAEALNVVHMRKPKQSESAQRRIRRPFSVSEVEALVQAVEKLGTGRWRDVKLRAFDNAKHRTYVDLKDKWKTLVHTARISPQQRRGEPVPQELLDRVLMAHAYWTQQAAKQQFKHHSEACLLL